MKTGSLYVDIDNILPIIKKHLYAERDIFVRELVSNSCDAIAKLNRLIRAGEAISTQDEFSVHIKINTQEKTITFSDNGLGMTAEEIEKYIGQVAFSGAKEFVENYGKGEGDNGIIGNFGLGFFSTYMVADLVEIISCSYKDEDKAVKWSCDGSSTYTIEEEYRGDHGTDVILYLSKDAGEYLESAKIQDILEKFCLFMPYSIYLDDLLINKDQPLWLQNPSDLTDSDYIAFYEAMFPKDPAPVMWVHLNTDYPFSLKGILYFLEKYESHTSAAKGIKVFSNRVYVSDDGAKILPEYLSIISGVIDFEDIPLDVSRSAVRDHAKMSQLLGYVSKKISEKLATLYRQDIEQYEKIWKKVGFILKFGMMQDPKFYDRIKKVLLWQNHLEKWTTIEDYLERKGDKTVYYMSPAVADASFAKVYEGKDVEILLAPQHVVDISIMELLEKKLEISFCRIDAQLDEILQEDKSTDESSENDQEQADAIEAFIPYCSESLNKSDIKIKTEALCTEHVPAVLILDEATRRKKEKQEIFRNHGIDVEEKQDEEEKQEQPQFILNYNNPLIQNIMKMEDSSELKELLVKEIYDITSLDQGEDILEGVQTFLRRTLRILELCTNAMNLTDTVNS